MEAGSSWYTSIFLLICITVQLSACDSVPTEEMSSEVEGSNLSEVLSQTDRNNPSDLPRDLRAAFQKPGTWTFAESAALTCQDGSSTGVGVRLKEDDTPSRIGGPFNLDNYSNDLVLFLEGGGACFNYLTCLQNRSSFSNDQFFSNDFVGGYSGIFDDSHLDNPVADWNFVYVPYCTGDEHAGSTSNGTVPPLDIDFDSNPDLPGLQNQHFVGYDNVSRVLDYIDRYLHKDYDRILLTGSSAGGVGALANYRQVAEAFPDAEVTLLDDSGPIFYDDDLLPVLLQELWQTTWDLSEALPPGSEGKDDVLEDIYDFIAETYPGASLGFVSFEQDFTIRFFYSFGQALTDPACAQALYGGLAMTPPQRNACIGGDTYEGALYELRDRLPSPWTTFYTSVPNPLLHTFLRDERFYVATADGQNLSDWITDLIDGTAQDRGSRPVP